MVSSPVRSWSGCPSGKITSDGGVLFVRLNRPTVARISVAYLEMAPGTLSNLLEASG